MIRFGINSSSSLSFIECNLGSITWVWGYVSSDLRMIQNNFNHMNDSSEYAPTFLLSISTSASAVRISRNALFDKKCSFIEFDDDIDRRAIPYILSFLSAHCLMVNSND